MQDEIGSAPLLVKVGIRSYTLVRIGPTMLTSFAPRGTGPRRAKQPVTETRMSSDSSKGAASPSKTTKGKGAKPKAAAPAKAGKTAKTTSKGAKK